MYVQSRHISTRLFLKKYLEKSQNILDSESSPINHVFLLNNIRTQDGGNPSLTQIVTSASYVLMHLSPPPGGRSSSTSGERTIVTKKILREREVHQETVVCVRKRTNV